MPPGAKAIVAEPFAYVTVTGSQVPALPEQQGGRGGLMASVEAVAATVICLSFLLL